MTITQRVIRSQKTSSINERVNAAEYLDSLAVTSMLGVLHQLGQLSEYAAEVFQGLYDLTSSTSARVSRLNSRLTTLDTDASEWERNFKQQPASKFYNAPARDAVFKRADGVEEQLFRPATQPLAIQKSRAEAKPAPPLQALDRFTAPEPAMKKFSNPGLFFEEWLKSEQEKQENLMEERKQRRARREKKQKENKPRQRVAKAEAVQVKTYSAFGAEFAPVQQQKQAQPVQRQPSLIQTQQQQQQQQSHSQSQNIPEPPQAMDPMARSQQQQHQQPPPVPPPVPAYAAAPGGAPPPPPPPPGGMTAGAPPPPPIPAAPQMGGYGAPPPPPVPQQTYSAPSAPPPPPAPFIPAAPPIPVAPPVPDFGDIPVPVESAETDDMLSPMQSAGGGGFLDSLRSGAKNLKKSEAQARRPSGRGGMLGDIKNKNFQLRKVDTAAAPKPAANVPMSIMALMIRRQQIQGSDDEESDDDEWVD